MSNVTDINAARNATTLAELRDKALAIHDEYRDSNPELALDALKEAHRIMATMLKMAEPGAVGKGKKPASVIEARQKMANRLAKKDSPTGDDDGSGDPD